MPLSGLAHADVRDPEAAVDTRREILALVGVVRRDGIGLDRSTVLVGGRGATRGDWPRRSPPQGENDGGATSGSRTADAQDDGPARPG